MRRWRGLDWERHGWFGVPAPSPRTVFPEAVLQDPWTAFIVAIDRAKKGDFRLIRRLLEGLDGRAEPYVEAQLAEVVATTAPDAVVDEVESRLRLAADSLPWDIMFELCSVVACRGRLSDVPTLLIAYCVTAESPDADSIGIKLSDMLEDEATAIATPRELPSVDGYRALVLKRQQELVASIGRSDALVYRGAEYSVERVARLALRDARSGRLDAFQRRDFEGATGIDCGGFYRKGRLQPLRAAAVVEEFIETEGYTKYRPGQRYFFGHPIPRE